MKKGLLLCFLLTLCINTATFAANFTVCKNTYALCTTAACSPVAGKDGLLSCACDVKTGYSAGQQSCQELKALTKGRFISSRYYPIKSYALCANDRPWAWCLDKPCMINKRHPSKASCACTAVKNQGDYIIVTNKYSKSTCTTGIISSATVVQVNQMNDFLKTQSDLQPFPIEVLKAQ